MALLREGQSRAEITGLSSRGSLSSAPISSVSSIPYSPPLTGSSGGGKIESKIQNIYLNISNSSFHSVKVLSNVKLGKFNRPLPESIVTKL